MTTQNNDNNNTASNLHNSNSEVEALVSVVGEKLVKFLVIAMVLFFVCFGFYFLIQSFVLCIVIFLTVLSWFGITL